MLPVRYSLPHINCAPPPPLIQFGSIDTGGPVLANQHTHTQTHSNANSQQQQRQPHNENTRSHFSGPAPFSNRGASMAHSSIGTPVSVVLCTDVCLSGGLASVFVCVCVSVCCLHRAARQSMLCVVSVGQRWRSLQTPHAAAGSEVAHPPLRPEIRSQCYMRTDVYTSGVCVSTYIFGRHVCRKGVKAECEHTKKQDALTHTVA